MKCKRIKKKKEHMKKNKSDEKNKLKKEKNKQGKKIQHEVLTSIDKDGMNFRESSNKLLTQMKNNEPEKSKSLLK